MNPFFDIIHQHKSTGTNGIYSVCSAHPFVLNAAFLQALEDHSPLLIEATCNQVNQYGGYTGMTPQHYVDVILVKANEYHFPIKQLILGGDHLGPNPWKHLNAEQAMHEADQMIAAFVEAGFTKIHLDCSMSCADDTVPLADNEIAKRAARLAKVAEQTAIRVFGQSELVYVIGTEVPIPGGATETLNELELTKPENALQTIEYHKRAFNELGLSDIWQRVVGLVVQPGVEFDHLHIIDFQPEKSNALSALIEQYDHIVYEAHSTDYQTTDAFRELVHHHFAILKVGPALTFAFREAVFALAHIEKALFSATECSHLIDVIDQQMAEHPENWQNYYHGDAQQQALARHYSFSDRIRYYWPNTLVEHALDKLLANLTSITIPLPLLSQYLPEQYRKIREGLLINRCDALIVDNIRRVLARYATACNMNQ